jgi:radical SAM superfamily enzyme YgiQ (UPF0313 family)
MALEKKTVHLVNIAAPFRYNVEDMTRPPSGILYVGGYLKARSYPVMVHHIREAEIGRAVDAILSDPSILFVGFSIMTGKQVALSADMSTQLKSRDPSVTIVWGGIHPSLMPEECLQYIFVDYVVIGEGEVTSLELAKHLELDPGEPPSAVSGIAFRHNGTTVLTSPRPFAKDMDDFRQDWSLVDIQKYIRINGVDRNFCFIASRGCPHSCGFCYNQRFNFRKWRGHSVERVVAEILKIRDLTGITSVTFDDDNFFTDKQRGLDILRRLKEQGIRCQWVELRVDYIREDLIAQLEALGVEAIFMGWESGSAGTLKKISKGFSPDLILEKTKLLSKFKGLIIDASAIVGFPWETEKDMRETVDLMLGMFRTNPFRLNFNIGIYVPYPGAPILQEAEMRGFTFPSDYNSWKKFDILSGDMELPWLSRKLIKKYTLIDRYAKLLFVYPRSPLAIRFISYLLAALAYIRLKSKFIAFPFEVVLAELYQKVQLKRRLRR